MIFVFGSNLAGIHGRGAARHAMKHYGAVWVWCFCHADFVVDLFR